MESQWRIFSPQKFLEGWIKRNHKLCWRRKNKKDLKFWIWQSVNGEINFNLDFMNQHKKKTLNRFAQRVLYSFVQLNWIFKVLTNWWKKREKLMNFFQKNIFLRILFRIFLFGKFQNKIKNVFFFESIEFPECCRLIWKKKLFPFKKSEKNFSWKRNRARRNFLKQEISRKRLKKWNKAFWESARIWPWILFSPIFIWKFKLSKSHQKNLFERFLSQIFFLFQIDIWIIIKSTKIYELFS